MKIRYRYVCGCAALILGVSVLFTLQPVAAPAGRESDSPQQGAATSAHGSLPEGTAQQRFDYFPDQYANQAKEPAEPMATF